MTTEIQTAQSIDVNVEEIRREFLNAVYQVLAGLSIHDLKNASLQRPLRNYEKSFRALVNHHLGLPLELRLEGGLLMINGHKIQPHFSIVEAQKTVVEAMDVAMLEVIIFQPQTSIDEAGEFFSKWALHKSIHRKPRALIGQFSQIELQFVDPEKAQKKLKNRQLLLSPGYALQRYFMLQRSAHDFFLGISKNELKSQRQLKRDFLEMAEIARVAPYNLVALSLLRPETGDPAMNIALSQALSTGLLSTVMAQELEFSFREQVNLGLVGLLYNVGLIGGEEMATILKSSTLTPVEYKRVLDAQASGVYKLIRLQGASRPVLERLLAIFEHSRGSQGKSISLALESRLLKLVSQYAALTSDRPFREAYTPNEAVRLLGSKATPQGGGDLDPLLYYIFVRFMGVVPVGSLVLLSDDRKGVVFRPSGEKMGAPMIKLLVSDQNDSSPLIDLGLEKNLEISRVLDPKREGVNVAAYFFD